MKIFCVGRNYSAHAKEMNSAIPEEPVIFLKPKSALFHNHSPFYYPGFTNELHYEAELVLRISKNGKHILNNHASKYYNAITVGIDFTARDIQAHLKKNSLPWEKAKAWDNSAVIGEWMPLNFDPANKPIQFSLKLNGNTVQRGNSSDMLFSFTEVIANISQYFAINIGDLVFTGTPAGVGECVVGDVLTGYYEDKQVFKIDVE